MKPYKQSLTHELLKNDPQLGFSPKKPSTNLMLNKVKLKLKEGKKSVNIEKSQFGNTVKYPFKSSSQDVKLPKLEMALLTQTLPSSPKK